MLEFHVGSFSFAEVGFEVDSVSFREGVSVLQKRVSVPELA